MTVEEIVEKYLRDNGFDGLCGDDCGCVVGDLFNFCDGCIGDCVPAYRVKSDCKNCERREFCSGDEDTKECYKPEKP